MSTPIHHEVVSCNEYLLLLWSRGSHDACFDCVAEYVSIIGSMLIEGTHLKCMIRMTQIAPIVFILAMHLDVSRLAAAKTPCLLVALNPLISALYAKINVPLYV